MKQIESNELNLAKVIDSSYQNQSICSSAWTLLNKSIAGGAAIGSGNTFHHNGYGGAASGSRASSMPAVGETAS